jgi:Holliday junction resolvase
MNGKGRRNKGADGERELVNTLNAAMGEALFKRCLGQARDGGVDLLAEGLAGIEVKRRERPELLAAIAQVRAAMADKPGMLKLVAYRRSREAWTFLWVMDQSELVHILAGILGRREA